MVIAIGVRRWRDSAGRGRPVRRPRPHL
jgi:hypothetical protein